MKVTNQELFLQHSYLWLHYCGLSQQQDTTLMVLAFNNNFTEHTIFILLIVLVVQGPTMLLFSCGTVIWDICHFMFTDLINFM